MEIDSNVEVLTIPCEYVEARTMTQSKAFWVTLYLLVEPTGHVHSFFHSSDMIENMAFALELGHKVYNTKLTVLCSQDFMPDMFNQILQYESVLKSKAITKSKSKYTFTKY